MKKEALMELGLTEELAEKTAAALGEELKGFVPKSRFDEVLEERNGLRAAGSEAEKRLAELEAAAGERETLLGRVEELQSELARKDELHAAEKRSAALESAIRLALTDAHDAALAASLVDRDGLDLDEQGNVTGLSEQLDALRAAKPFLFRRAAPGFAVGMPPARSGAMGSGAGPTMRDTIARHFETQRG